MIPFPSPGAGNDAAAPLNALIAQAAAGKDNRIVLDADDYELHGPLLLVPNVHLMGSGKDQTGLFKRFHGGTAVKVQGAPAGTSGSLEELFIGAAAGFAPGIGILLTGDAADQPDEFLLRRLYISSDDGSLWTVTLMMDGAARTTPLGLRDCVIEDCEFFNAATATLWLRSVIGLEMRGGGVFPGAGPASGCGIWLGGTEAIKSADCDFSGVNNNGVLNLTNTVGACSWRGGSVGTLDTDASPGWFIGGCPAPASVIAPLTASTLAWTGLPALVLP